MNCLDVGCGAGTVTRMMAHIAGEKGHVTGMGVDEAYLQYCQNNSTAKTDFMRDDICNSRLVEKGERYDIVYSRFIFVHLKDGRKAMRSMKQLVKKGGAMVIEELATSQIRGCTIQKTEV
jgi:2-polyprenyl-3-methyl-5-hydroxy-6-metoxy-1,4-benzoquinol methylase